LRRDTGRPFMISFTFFAIVLLPFLLVLLFLSFLLHPFKVRIKPTVSPANQFAVKSPFAATGFVAGDQQDRAALRVESECNTPDAVLRIEAQFLHIRVAGILQRVYARSSQLWPELA
jgi:hypothetical protein